MPISIIGTPQVGNTTNGGNLTLTFSTAPIEGDYVVVYGGSSSGAVVTDAGTGYTRISLAGDGFNVSFGVWIKKMSASPDTTVLCRGNAEATAATAYGCYVFRGVDGTTPQDVTATTASSNSGSPNCASITSVTDLAWVLALAGSNVNDASIGSVSGYSNQYTTVGVDTNSITVAGTTLEKTTAGVEDPAAWSTWASGRWRAVTVALRPAASGGWANIGKINGVTATTFGKINRIPINEIGKVNRVPV